ncbi:MAG: type II toxin-antitoxin system RelE/ParE family toxin [Elusimicrobiota bacterium]
MQKEEYKVLLLPSAQRDLDDIKDKKTLAKIKAGLLVLKSDSRPRGCNKLLSQQDAYRIRFGNYRCCYRIDDTAKSIFVYRIKHRKEVYR